MKRQNFWLGLFLFAVSLSGRAQSRDIPEGILDNCDSSLTLAQYDELLELSDLTTFSSYAEAPQRTRRISEIFAEAGDRRGLFASMYVAITDESYNSTLPGVYENQQMDEQLVYVFAQRYLGPLHNYLSGMPTDPKWLQYFKLAADCRASPLNVLGTGVNTHLTYDLPNTLRTIGADLSFRADFMKFGEVLIDKTKDSTDLLEAQQGVDASGLFSGFIFGKAIDHVLGERATGHFLFQAVRTLAWDDFETYYKNESPLKGDASVNRRWELRQQVLKFMP